MRGMWKKSAVIRAEGFIPRRLRRGMLIAVMCMALLCVSAHGEGASQEQKKIPNGVEGMIEKFLQRGKYIKLPFEDEDIGEAFIYLWAANIKGILIGGNFFAILTESGSEPMGCDLSENSLSLDSECNIIIKPKK